MKTICAGCGAILTNEAGERLQSGNFTGNLPGPTKDTNYAWCDKCVKNPQRGGGEMMQADEITRKWESGTLRWSDISDYLRTQITPTSVYPIIGHDLDHITSMCHKLYQHSRYGRPTGDFLSAVVSDSWSEVCLRADDTNRQWGWMIHAFLYNCAPANWKTMHKEEEK